MLGLGLKIHLNPGGKPLSPFIKNSITSLRESRYTIDISCLKSSLNKIYESPLLSLYTAFQYIIDTTEYGGYYVDRYCLHQETDDVSENHYYDELYRPYIGNIRALVQSAGGEFLGEEGQWWEVIVQSGAEVLDFECLERTMNGAGEERFDPNNCLYQTSNLFDDNFLWLSFTKMENLLTLKSVTVLDRSCLYNTFKSFAA